jgi:RNA polymerase sigma-70 factor (ECF subfamily)
VRENGGWMLAVARRLVSDEALAQDCVQNAFADVFKGLDGFEERSRLRTWMHRIVVNQALMALRKQKRLQEISIDDLLPAFDQNQCRIEERWISAETPESLMQQAQTKDAVLSMIDRLPENFRIVLLLRDIEEMSTSDVAQTLQISESNVKVRLHRARSALKMLLEPLLRGESS